MLSNNFVLAFDDAYYQKRKYNFSYINMLRAKFNLKKFQSQKIIMFAISFKIQKYLKNISQYL